MLQRSMMRASLTDSAVKRLAGSMGKRGWVLLGHRAHWLWLLDRTDSSWHVSVRMFRPGAKGDWDYVFDSASVELMKLAKLTRGSTAPRRI